VGQGEYVAAAIGTGSRSAHLVVEFKIPPAGMLGSPAGTYGIENRSKPATVYPAKMIVFPSGDTSGHSAPPVVCVSDRAENGLSIGNSYRLKG
jgi:hypothetical protein